MKKPVIRTEVQEGIHAQDESRFEPNIENDKRRRALPHYTSLHESSRHFFERVVSAKKEREFIFITKIHERNR